MESVSRVNVQTPRQLILNFMSSESDRYFSESVDMIYKKFCSKLEKITIHLNFDDKGGIIQRLLSRCDTLRWIEVDMTDGFIWSADDQIFTEFNNVIHLSIYARQMLDRALPLFFTSWSMEMLMDLRLENVHLTEDAISFLARYGPQLRYLEICTDFDNVVG